MMRIRQRLLAVTVPMVSSYSELLAQNGESMQHAGTIGESSGPLETGVDWAVIFVIGQASLR